MPGAAEPRTKAAQRAATVARLVSVGRELFGRLGYAQAATEEIVARAGVTRGALYHHFGTKEGLFRAVLEEVQRDVAGRIAAAAEAESDPWRRLEAGCRAFLTASVDPQVWRILLVDAPAVVGWDVWREVDIAHGTRLLVEALDALAAGGRIDPPSVAALGHLLSGAMNEAALWIAGAGRVDQALAEATATLAYLLAALRQQGAATPSA